jgi:hypothetical protein
VCGGHVPRYIDDGDKLLIRMDGGREFITSPRFDNTVKKLSLHSKNYIFFLLPKNKDYQVSLFYNKNSTKTSHGTSFIFFKNNTQGETFKLNHLKN